VRMASFEEIFRELNESMKRMRELDYDKMVQSGGLKGRYEVKEIDEQGVKGYFVQGRFWSDQPLDPFDPYEPLNPSKRRPMPRRPFSIPENALREIREPLTDVFEEENAVKIYIELRGEEKDDIRLNVTEGEVEVKAKNFYKLIDVPENIDIEKASSKYNNGVLQITIPKKEEKSGGKNKNITIE
jgi:HSP20 family molecular chaperone IbpA